MKTSKKVICLLLTLIMVVSSLPMVALEAEAKTNNSVITYQPQATSKAQKIVNIAKKEVGNNHKKYTKWYGMSGDWCCVFVSWCANKAGVSTKIIPKASVCSGFVKFFRNKKQFHTESKYIPVPGDLIFYDGDKGKYKDPNKIYSHVGIVVSYNKKTKQITTIEGNVGNNNWRKSKVVKRTQKRTGHMAFAHPKY